MSRLRSTASTDIRRSSIAGRKKWWSEHVIPEPYRTAGIDVLLDRGLITANARGFRPSDEVIFSLRLDRWQY